MNLSRWIYGLGIGALATALMYLAGL